MSVSQESGYITNVGRILAAVRQSCDTDGTLYATPYQTSSSTSGGQYV